MDRLISGSTDGIGERLADSLRTASDISDGLVIVDIFDENNEKDSLLFSEKFACPVSGFTLERLSRGYFF